MGKSLQTLGFKHEQWGRYSYGSQRIATCERNIGGEGIADHDHIGKTTVNWLLSRRIERGKSFCSLRLHCIGRF